MKKKMGCWYMLLLAIVFEVTGTSSMKFFSVQGGLEGYAIMILLIGCSYWALGKALVRIPMSLAYAVWEGVGLMGTSAVAWFVFHESMPPTKLLALIVILVGLVMIKKGTVRMTTGEYIHDN